MKSKRTVVHSQEKDAVRREDRPSFQRLLSLFNALQYSLDPHIHALAISGFVRFRISRACVLRTLCTIPFRSIRGQSGLNLR